ncbi:MAG: C45 family autoproteolytic acyltransferase/hydrolase [Thermodesulfobacteriota bacterium]
MMKNRTKHFTFSLILMVSLAVFAGMVLCGQALAARTYAPDGKGYLEYITTDTGHQQPFLHLEGTGYEMGFQHGYLMGTACTNTLSEAFLIDFCSEYIMELGDFGDIIVNLLLADVGEWVGLDYGESGMRPADFLLFAFKRIAKHNEQYIPPEYLDEMRGIVDGAAAVGVVLDYEEVLLVNVGFDALLSFAYPLATPVLATASALGQVTGIQLACNAFVMDGNATVGDSLYMGRDFMFSGQRLTDNPLIYEFCGDGRNRVVSVGITGLIGSMAAMNEKGLGIGMDMVPSGDCTPADFGMGCLLTARHAMEQADELSQGLSVIQNAKRGVSWLYVLADGRGVERGGASVETSAHHVYTRYMDTPPADPFLQLLMPSNVRQQESYPDFVLQTNHYVLPDMYLNVPLNVGEADSVHRYDRMMEIFKDPNHPLGGYGTYDFDKAFDYINWMYLTGEENETPDSRVDQSTTLFDLTTLRMKTLCGPTFAQGATEYALPADPPPPSAFSFKSYHGTYFCAENNGGNTVNANRTAIGDWEKFVVTGTDGKTDNIADGETVTIRTGKNYYFNAKKKVKVLWWYTGGGLDADTTAPQTFKLINHTRPGGTLQNGDLISLKTIYSTYVVAESDGDALADRTSIGNWEKFNVIFH